MIAAYRAVGYRRCGNVYINSPAGYTRRVASDNAVIDTGIGIVHVDTAAGLFSGVIGDNAVRNYGFNVTAEDASGTCITEESRKKELICIVLDSLSDKYETQEGLDPMMGRNKPYVEDKQEQKDKDYKNHAYAPEGFNDPLAKNEENHTNEK